MKEWKEYVVNYDAQPDKKSTFYKTHKSEILVILLTIGCNTAIENWSRFLKSICTPLTSNLSDISKDTSHLVDLIDDISKSSLPDNLILLSLDIVNMFANIDSEREMEAVRSLLDSILDGRTGNLTHILLTYIYINKWYCNWSTIFLPI